MLDQHRARVLDQLRNDWQRQREEYDQIAAARDARRATSAQIRAHMDDKHTQEQRSHESRLEGLRARRAQFEAQRTEKEREAADTIARRQVSVWFLLFEL